MNFTFWNFNHYFIIIYTLRLSHSNYIYIYIYIFDWPFRVDPYLLFSRSDLGPLNQSNPLLLQGFVVRPFLTRSCGFDGMVPVAQRITSCIWNYIRSSKFLQSGITRHEIDLPIQWLMIFVSNILWTRIPQHTHSSCRVKPCNTRHEINLPI